MYIQIIRVDVQVVQVMITLGEISDAPGRPPRRPTASHRICKRYIVLVHILQYVSLYTSTYAIFLESIKLFLNIKNT